jgi:acyl carrier protein
MSTDAVEIREKVKDYIKQATFVEKDKIKNDSLIFKEGYFDSMGFVVLITYLEENFGIKTTDADLIEENFESINAITDFIVRKSSN